MSECVGVELSMRIKVDNTHTDVDAESPRRVPTSMDLGRAASSDTCVVAWCAILMLVVTETNHVEALQDRGRGRGRARWWACHTPAGPETQTWCGG